MSTGRTFDIGDTSSRTPASSHRNSVQVTLIHEQIPNLTIEDNISETDPDWENHIEFNHLTQHTLQSKMRDLLDQKKLLPLVVKILTMVSTLRDQYYFEFEIQSHNLMVTQSTEDSEESDFIMVNQAIPLVYRHML